MISYMFSCVHAVREAFKWLTGDNALTCEHWRQRIQLMRTLREHECNNGWEIRAEWHGSHIGMQVCRTAWFKNNDAAVTCRSWFIFNDSRTLLSAGCEHAGIMQRTDDKGIIQHMPCSEPRRFPAACRSLKLTLRYSLLAFRWTRLESCFKRDYMQVSMY